MFNSLHMYTTKFEKKFYLGEHIYTSYLFTGNTHQLIGILMLCTWAIMVMSRTEFPNGKTLLLIVERSRLLRWVNTLSITLFCFLQWMRINTSFSKTLASTSGSATLSLWQSSELVLPLEAEPSSLYRWALLMNETDSTFIFLQHLCSSNSFARFWSCLT